MKKTIHRSDSRGLADHGWLKSRHTFSFADYYDPQRNRFGLLRVLNDDIVEPGKGFGSHPHDNMEIVSIPLKGALAHKDSEGNEHVINSGDVQIMSAGSGLYHSEYNASKTEPVNFLQIWVFPKAKDITPRYDQRTFNAKDRDNLVQTVISPEKSEKKLWINQDAYFSLCSIEKGKKVRYKINKNGNGLYIFVIEGTVKTDGEILNRRDAIGLEELENIEITAEGNCEILLIEVPMVI
ncbi:MAG: pirin family protein [Ignavibacteria bacterium]